MRQRRVLPGVIRPHRAIVDPAPDNATISLRDRFAAADVFRIVAVVPRIEDVDPLFASGAAQQAVVFDPGFANDLGKGVPANLLVLTDSTEPNTGSLLQSYAQAVVSQWTRETGRAGAAGRAGPFGAAEGSVVCRIGLVGPANKSTTSAAHIYLMPTLLVTLGTR